MRTIIKCEKCNSHNVSIDWHKLSIILWAIALIMFSVMLSIKENNCKKNIKKYEKILK